MKGCIFIYGPPASGKSTVGKLLAENLGVPFTDLDTKIENKSGLSIAQIFSKHGESGFRKIEQEVLSEFIMNDSGVCALGGGALTNPECMDLVNTSGPIVCLMGSFDALFSRITNMKKGERPLLSNQPEAQLKQLLARRTDHYESFSQKIDTNGKSPNQIAWEAQTLLGKFRLVFGEQKSDIIVLDDLDSIGMAVNLQFEGNSKVAVVSDDQVAPIFAGRVVKSLQNEGFDAHLIQFPSGEDNKSLSTVSYLWNEFIRIKLERKSLVIGLGGGVVSDVTGFSAATFLRGLPWAVIPTTLLSMVDASIGGKTGIDLEQGKNLVGAFHFPRQVLLSPSTLATLPAREFQNGLAEVVKHGIIGDPDLFEICKQGDEYIKKNLRQLILKAVAVKISIVQNDPYELNRRAELNLGHTIGHALELLSHYELHHGEAVSIGMAVETELAEKLGLAKPGLKDEIVGVLSAIGLPTSLPPWVTLDSLMGTMQMDKKRSNGRVHFSLPLKIGEVKAGIVIENLSELLIM